MDTQLLQTTFNRAKQENGGLTALGMRFYQRLFEKYPQVRPLFNTPPEEQHKKLMASIGAIVSSVNHPEQMVPFLRAMGIRHVVYGTLPDHYPAVAENLMAVLQEHLSVEGDWTEAMAQTWETALNTVAGVMIEAANNPKQFETELVEAGYRPDGFKPNSDTPWVLETV